MTVKEWLRFIYGMALGTSVPYIKPNKRYLWPVRLHEVDANCFIYEGGSANSIILRSQDQSLIVNTNSAEAAEHLHHEIKKRHYPAIHYVLNSNVYRDFSGGNSLYLEKARYFLPEVTEQMLRQNWPDRPQQIEYVNHEQVLQFGDEKIILVDIKNAASHSDLAIYFERKKILVLGALFYNKIHPVLHPLDGMNIDQWVLELERLMTRFQPDLVIPAEGELAKPQDVVQFISYLKNFKDPKVEFSECRRLFDWKEIPGQTSLEENFDLIREKMKTHTHF